VEDTVVLNKLIRKFIFTSHDVAKGGGGLPNRCKDITSRKIYAVCICIYMFVENSKKNHKAFLEIFQYIIVL
jgi:hypothetical protein